MLELPGITIHREEDGTWIAESLGPLPRCRIYAHTSEQAIAITQIITRYMDVESLLLARRKAKGTEA